MKLGCRVRIVGAKNIRSKFGIIVGEICPGAYFVKVGIKADRDNSFLLLGEDYLKAI